jgi:hypothetical protein
MEFSRRQAGTDVLFERRFTNKIDATMLVGRNARLRQKRDYGLMESKHRADKSALAGIAAAAMLSRLGNFRRFAVMRPAACRISASSVP